MKLGEVDTLVTYMKWCNESAGENKWNTGNDSGETDESAETDEMIAMKRMRWKRWNGWNGWDRWNEKHETDETDETHEMKRIWNKWMVIFILWRTNEMRMKMKRTQNVLPKSQPESSKTYWINCNVHQIWTRPQMFIILTDPQFRGRRLRPQGERLLF